MLVLATDTLACAMGRPVWWSLTVPLTTVRCAIVSKATTSSTIVMHIFFILMPVCYSSANIRNSLQTTKKKGYK